MHSASAVLSPGKEKNPVYDAAVVKNCRRLLPPKLSNSRTHTQAAIRGRRRDLSNRSRASPRHPLQTWPTEIVRSQPTRVLPPVVCGCLGWCLGWCLGCKHHVLWEWCLGCDLARVVWGWRLGSCSVGVVFGVLGRTPYTTPTKHPHTGRI